MGLGWGWGEGRVRRALAQILAVTRKPRACVLGLVWGCVGVMHGDLHGGLRRHEGEGPLRERRELRAPGEM